MMGLLIHKRKSYLIPTQEFLFLGYQFDLISFHVTPALDRHLKILGIIQSILNRRGGDMLICGRSCQVCLQKQRNYYLWVSQALHVATLGFQSIKQQMWIPISPAADEDLQWWISGHDVPMGARVIPKDPDAHLFTDVSNIGWGAHWELLDSLRCLADERENTSYQCARVRGRTPNSAPLTEAAHGLNSSCCFGQLHCSILHQQAGRDMVNIAVQTDQEVTPLVPEQQDSAIPGRMNVRADVLSRPTQMSGTQ